MRYAANRKRGSSLQSASGPTLGVSCPPSGAFLLHTLSSGPLLLHWDPRFRGLIDAQDQLLTDISLRPRSRPLGGDPGICRFGGSEKLSTCSGSLSNSHLSVANKQLQGLEEPNKASAVSWSSCWSWRLSI